MTFADPIFCDRCREARKGRFAFVAGLRSVERRGDADHQRRRGLDLEREVGENTAHGGLVGQLALEGRAVPRMPCGLRKSCTHSRGGPCNAVEPCTLHHIDDGPYAPTFFPDTLGPGAVIFDLGRGVGAVAELVLEPHDVNGIAGPVGAPARHEKAGQTAFCVGEGQKGVGHGGGTEPLVADQLIFPRAERMRACSIRANVATALLLGHRHAHCRASLLSRRDKPRVISAAGNARLPFSGYGRFGAERGNDRVSHRHRAGRARVGLGHEVEERSVQRMTRLFGGPGRPRHARFKTEAHELVVGGMKLDFVDPVAEAVEGFQLWRIFVGKAPPFERLETADAFAKYSKLVAVRSRPVSFECALQRNVELEGVEIHKGWRLVEHLMRGKLVWQRDSRHIRVSPRQRKSATPHWAKCFICPLLMEPNDAMR